MVLRLDGNDPVLGDIVPFRNEVAAVVLSKNYAWGLQNFAHR